MHVGQSVIAALKPVGQSRVIQSQQMQNRGLNVMHMYWILNDVEPEFIRCSKCHSGTQTTAGHPHGVGKRMMIAAKDDTVGRAAFAKRGTTEFTHPDDQCFAQQASLLQIFDQRGDGPIHQGTTFDKSIPQILARIGPMKIPDLKDGLLSVSWSFMFGTG